MNLESVARYLILAGVGLVTIGLLLYGLAKLNLPIGSLPGDIRIEWRNGSFYFPLTTSILISMILTLLLNLLGRFWRK